MGCGDDLMRVDLAILDKFMSIMLQFFSRSTLNFWSDCVTNYILASFLVIGKSNLWLRTDDVLLYGSVSLLFVISSTPNIAIN